MNYTYYCECGKEKPVKHGMEEQPTIQCDCGLIMQKKIGDVQFSYHSLKWSRDYSAQTKYGGMKVTK